MLTPDVQAMIRKPETRPDAGGAEDRRRLFPRAAHRRRQDPGGHAEGRGDQVQGAAEGSSQAHRRGLRRWPPTGRWKKIAALLKQKSYILTTGDPKRPEKDKPVEPGCPFQPANMDFREGRREAFVDWLTAPAESVVRPRRGQPAFGGGISAKACRGSPATSACWAAGRPIRNCSTGWLPSSWPTTTA